MDVELKRLDPTLVCTCNDLYVADIEEAAEDFEEDYTEIMQYHYTLPRCGECQCHVEDIVATVRDATA